MSSINNFTLSRPAESAVHPQPTEDRGNNHNFGDYRLESGRLSINNLTTSESARSKAALPARSVRFSSQVTTIRYVQEADTGQLDPLYYHPSMHGSEQNPMVRALMNMKPRDPLYYAPRKFEIGSGTDQPSRKTMDLHGRSTSISKLEERDVEDLAEADKRAKRP